MTPYFGNSHMSRRCCVGNKDVNTRKMCDSTCRPICCPTSVGIKARIGRRGLMRDNKIAQYFVFPTARRSKA